MPENCGIVPHAEGVDLLPSNIEPSSMEVNLFNIMSREFVLRGAVENLKKNCEGVLVDCMPSLGRMTINSLVAADSVLVPAQPNDLSPKGVNLLMRFIARAKKPANPKLRIDGILLTAVDNRTNNAKSVIASLRSGAGENISDTGEGNDLLGRTYEYCMAQLAVCEGVYDGQYRKN